MKKRLFATIVAAALFGANVTAFAQGSWEWVVEPLYTLPETACGFGETITFSEGLARVGYDGKWGYISENGKVVIPISFANAGDFNGDLALASLSGWRYGLIRFVGEQADNAQWEWATQPLYNLSFDNSKTLRSMGYVEEVTLVKQNGKWGYIDGNMEVVIPFIFECAGNFWGDMALVSLDGESYGFIRYNTPGKEAPAAPGHYAPSTVVLYNGALINFSRPVVEKGGVDFYPFEDFMQAVGVGYEWDSETNVISGKFNGNILGVSLSENVYLLNGDEVPNQSNNAPFVANERTYVDLVYVINNLGMSVEWDSESARIISIE